MLINIATNVSHTYSLCLLYLTFEAPSVKICKKHTNDLITYHALKYLTLKYVHYQNLEFKDENEKQYQFAMKVRKSYEL